VWRVGIHRDGQLENRELISVIDRRHSEQVVPRRICGVESLL